MKGYLLGFFDGDGWISKTGKTWQFGIVSSKNFIYGLRRHLYKILDIKYRKIRKKNKVYCYHISAKNDLIKLYNYLYKGASIFLNRKFINFNEAIQ